MKRILLSLFAAAVALAGADVSGKWTGTMEKVKGGPSGPPVEEYRMTLRQNGDAITGTVGPTNAAWEIRDAKLAGDKLTFETSIAGGKFVIAFDLDVKGDEMAGKMESRQGPAILGNLRFKREK